MFPTRLATFNLARRFASRRRCGAEMFVASTGFRCDDADGWRISVPWDEVMHKWKAGTLQSGGGGKVKSQKQAVAIMLSEKRKAGAGKKEYQSKKHFYGE
jgi:hypothetical protein